MLIVKFRIEFPYEYTKFILKITLNTNISQCDKLMSSNGKASKAQSVLV